MEFLIVFGLIMVIIAIVVKFNTSFKVKENSTCIEKDSKIARENKINFYIFLIVGIIFILVGIILLCVL